MNHNGGPVRFIDPEVLSRISNMELLARNVVEGFISGLHRSPYKGFSVEFLEYRPYIPGDDPMRIDWKLYARSDKLFMKEFEDETNSTCHILLDISNSMEFTTTKVTKFQYGAMLAASLAYFMIRQKDRVGMYFFDDCIRERIPAQSRKGHLINILHSIEHVRPGARSSIGKPFHELADAISKRGIIIIISDLLDDPAAILDGLRHFRFDGNDAIVFQVLDPFELTFQYRDIVELECMETGEKLMVMSEAAREAYRENLERFKTTMKRECGLLGIDYEILDTGKPLDYALFQYLSKRSKRRL